MKWKRNVTFPYSAIESGKLKKIKGNSIKVYLVIKAYSNWKTGKSKVGYNKIVKLTGITNMLRIKAHIVELRDAGLITFRNLPIGDSKFTKNWYRILNV